MNKKFLSAILFGALMVTSTGTFVSCKDYDDDIDQINNTLNDLKSQIAALQTAVDNGDYVTGITKTADGKGMTFTFSKGSPVTVTLDVKDGEAGAPGTPGKDAQQVTVDEKTGELKIDGEGTGIFPTKDAAKAPVKADGGYWYTLNEKGEYVNTNIPVSGITVSGSEADGYTLTVYDAKGTPQVIELPTASSLISEIEFVGYRSYTGTNVSKENGFVPMHQGAVTYKAFRVASSEPMKNWKGNKAKLKAGDVTVAYNTNGLVARITPNNIDASTLKFSLVNSKNAAAPLTVSLSEFTNGDAALTRAASKNGMYNVNFACEVIGNVPAADIDNSAWEKKFGTSTKPILFGLTSSTLPSKFDVAMESQTDAMSINKVKIDDTTNGTDITATDPTATPAGNPHKIESNKTYTLSLEEAAFVYDSYLEFQEDQALYWKIEYNQADAPMSFTVKRMPDSQTPATINITVHYAQMDGIVGRKVVSVTPQTNLNGIQLSDMKKLDIVAADANDLSKNSITVPLSKMVEALGNDGYITWKADADLTKTSTLANGNIYIIGDNNAPIADTYVVTFLKSDGKITTNAAEAASVRFTFKNNAAITLDQNYVATINFASNKVDKYYGNIVNTVYFPLSFSIPAFTDLLQKDENVFMDEKQEVASAYMLEKYDETASGEWTSTYKFKGAFKNLAANVAKGFTFTFALDNDANNKPADNKTSADLALIAAGSYNSTATTSVAVTAANANDVAITLRNDYKAKSYGKALTVKVTAPKYVGVYTYDATSFKIKVLSPIKEGKFMAEGGAVKIAATGTTDITKNNVWGETSGAQRYELFYGASKKQDGTFDNAWSRKDIKGVKFSSDGIKFTVENEDGVPTKAQLNADGTTKVESTITLRAVGNKGDRSKLKVAVTDNWNYTIEKEVDVVVE